MYTNIVVIGQPRSGTQLLRGLLDQHSQIQMLEREPLKKFRSHPHFDLNTILLPSSKPIIGFVVQSTDLVSNPNLQKPVLDLCSKPTTFTIRVHRRNRLRQAISYLHAERSGEWTIHVGLPRSVPFKKITVNVDRVIEIMELLDASELFQNGFLKYDFTINYENFYTAYNKVSNQIFKAMGITKKSVLPTTRITHGKALIEWVLNYEELHSRIFQSKWQDHL
jgi:hypothetical protein